MHYSEEWKTRLPVEVLLPVRDICASWSLTELYKRWASRSSDFGGLFQQPGAP